MQEIIYAITMQSVLFEIAHRLDPETLSEEDIELAKQEVVAALEHHLDPREHGPRCLENH